MFVQRGYIIASVLAIYDAMDQNVQCCIDEALSAGLLKFEHEDCSVFNEKENSEMVESIFSMVVRHSSQDSIERLAEMVKDVYRCVCRHDKPLRNFADRFMSKA